ncbi:uncharacterized protein SCO1/SenC/PrrC, involved in biogenesis of respiratory and photosynthetic systems [Beggiatoa alba B18LD]|uniref:Uncharacterized protein SCO1/SenC/PrrC, involved in biogenesis of respiratory and photosynthetic systems n=1 Tax=Beggiatoa alba B18LD TaxID=395493 RepID=U5FCF1_9GAMM|nr:SCO family protein [Beggiatoa alba]EIJ41757.1 uncharacterized protein SCO1/SenC/PrrC, involved in biogenesis of respiratory and photosynthetic systems [Beggiatoa alba B18LD]
MMMTQKSFVPWVAGISLLAMITGISVGFWLSQRTSTTIEGLHYPDAPMLTEFKLTNQLNQPFTLDSFKGKWTLIFFGYTHCPDICPLALSVLKSVKLSLTNLSESTDTQFVFISVDGERDTPVLLKQYLNYFDPEFIGATGNASEVLALTRQLGIVYFRGSQQADGSYLVDHSSSILLINPKAQFVGTFAAPHIPDVVLQRYLKMRRFLEKQI